MPLRHPISAAYKWVTHLRNKLYDRSVFKSASFTIPLISVGNLAVGGTGKTPHIAYLIELLKKNDIAAASLSRGYGRRSKGLHFAETDSPISRIGDEAKQLKLRFPDTVIAVAENRAMAVPFILAEHPETQAILLDDAYQHRSVKPSLNILLTAFHRPFPKDQLLPAGRLREAAENYKRADVIIVTKCPEQMSNTQMDELRDLIQPLAHQRLFFSSLIYQKMYPLFSKDGYENKAVSSFSSSLLVCGIADPIPLEQHLSGQISHLNTLFFKDHHRFNTSDLSHIKQKWEAMRNETTDAHPIIITTEKDAVRLEEHKSWIQEHKLPIWVLAVQVQFLSKNSSSFDQHMIEHIQTFESE